jgi:D-ribose pyranase
MKKTALLHAELSRLIASLGHGERLVIADAGLPVPAGTPCVDLAVTRGVPGFEAVLRAVLSEMCVERIVVATEARAASPAFVAMLAAALPGVAATELAHADFKALTAGARAVVRTGEFTPYANVILYAGVVF